MYISPQATNKISKRTQHVFEASVPNAAITQLIPKVPSLHFPRYSNP